VKELIRAFTTAVTKENLTVAIVCDGLGPSVIIQKEHLAGTEIKRANKYDGSNNYTGHMSFLAKHLTTATAQPNHNAWNKRRAQTPPPYYSTEDFPLLPNAKAARTETMENPLFSNEYMHTEPNDEILVDFDSEIKKRT
jgi:hypothetical protein